jgi:GntR family transcriptional regulator
MEAHHASRATVREALNVLREEGIVDRQQGTGTFVISRNAAAPLREAHGVVRPQTNSMFENRSAIELDRSWVPTPDAVAARLESELEKPCLRLEYLVLAGGEVIGIATNYVLNPEASSIEGLALSHNWYDLLDRAQLVVAESEFTIGCRIADERTTCLLSVDARSAVLAVEQVIKDTCGRPYNFAYIILRGDRQFVSRARQEATHGHPL